MKKSLTFIALCFFCLTKSSAQSNCSNPTVVTVCPGVLLTGQTNAGMGDDAPAPCNIVGNDIAYRVYVPGGASKLYVSIVSASASLRLIVEADTCGTSSCLISSVSSGTATRTFNISAVNYYTVWVDASSTVTFGISFGAATSAIFITIPDTQGNLQFDSSTCAAPVFNPAKPFFQVAYNNVYLTNPMTLSPLNVPGVLKIVAYFKNTTGSEAIKRFIFQFNPFSGTGFINISPAPSVFPGFYRAGNWQATGSGNSRTFNFNDAAIPGKGDFNGTPNTCLRYEFNFNVTPISNNPTNTTVTVIGTSDGFGVGFNGFVYSGCCPTNFATCLGLSSGDPTTAVNGFSFGFADPAAPLPVTLLGFSAEQERDHILLHWSTASETNNDYFTIEKSQDGSSWSVVDFVDGAGTSSTTLSYQSIDENPFSGLSYYRLKQTDYDGTSEYFSPVNVLFKANEIEIFPNPASTQIEVFDYSLAGISGMALYNALGKKMQLSLLKNHAGTVLNVSELPRGLYLLVVEGTNGDILKQEKIVLTR